MTVGNNLGISHIEHWDLVINPESLVAYMKLIPVEISKSVHHKGDDVGPMLEFMSDITGENNENTGTIHNTGWKEIAMYIRGSIEYR